jgi:flagellin-like protein
MMKFRENEDAVSPVIGVILMVAITVILAAVIAAFVFGMAGGVDTKQKVVAATASSTVGDGSKLIYITYQGGPDADLVQKVTYVVFLANAEESATPQTGDVTSDSGETAPNVGAVAKVKGTPGQKDHVVVTAHFYDGSKQVILDTNV